MIRDRVNQSTHARKDRCSSNSSKRRRHSQRDLLEQIFTVGKRTDGTRDAGADRSLRRQPVPRHAFTNLGFTVCGHDITAAGNGRVLAGKFAVLDETQSLTC
jgi:hypothetical protein